MKTYPKFFLALIVVFVVISMISCGSDADETNKVKESKSEVTTVKKKKSNEKESQEDIERKVSITLPKCGGTFRCESIRDNQCFFTVKGTSSNIQEGEFISIMLKFPSGEEWWQGGNSLSKDEFIGDDWTISMISVDPNGISKYFNLRAIVTEKPLLSGMQYTDLPPYLAVSTICLLQLSN
jgi:hypothetical protein